MQGKQFVSFLYILKYFCGVSKKIILWWACPSWYWKRVNEFFEKQFLSVVVHNIFLSPNSTITPLQLNTRGEFHLDFKIVKHRHPSCNAFHQSGTPLLQNITYHCNFLFGHLTCLAKNSSKFSTTKQTAHNYQRKK
jgi:hypothetical protein